MNEVHAWIDDKPVDPEYIHSRRNGTVVLAYPRWKWLPEWYWRFRWLSKPIATKGEHVTIQCETVMECNV